MGHINQAVGGPSRLEETVFREQMANFLEAAVPLLLVMSAFRFLDPYRPELHYMRGPGPKWREKHGAPPMTARE